MEEALNFLSAVLGWADMLSSQTMEEAAAMYKSGSDICCGRQEKWGIQANMPCSHPQHAHTHYPTILLPSVCVTVVILGGGEQITSDVFNIIYIMQTYLLLSLCL